MSVQRPPPLAVEALKPVFFVSDIGFVAAPGTGHEPVRIMFLLNRNRHGRNLRSFTVYVPSSPRRTIPSSVNYGFRWTPPMSFVNDMLVPAPRFWNDVH